MKTHKLSIMYFIGIIGFLFTSINGFAQRKVAMEFFPESSNYPQQVSDTTTTKFKAFEQVKQKSTFQIEANDFSSPKIKMTAICYHEFPKYHPQISGSRIVWFDGREEEWAIYMYDLSTKVESRVTTVYARHENENYYFNGMAFDGFYIAWADYRNGNWDIYLHNIITHAEIQLTDGSDMQIYPDLNGPYVVWMDENFSDMWYRYFNIDCYNIVTEKITLLSRKDYINMDRFPQIFGNKLIFYSDYFDQRNIADQGGGFQ